MTVMGIHRPDTVIVFLITGQHRNQQPGIQCALNVVIRKLNNANPLEGGIKQGWLAKGTLYPEGSSEAAPKLWRGSDEAANAADGCTTNLEPAAPHGFKFHVCRVLDNWQ